MALFKRKSVPSPDPAIAEMIKAGHSLIELTARGHAQMWGLGTSDRWGVDQTTATITWTWPDRIAVAPVQALGSYNLGANSWLWAWANNSIEPAMKEASLQVRAWGEEHGQTTLTTPKLEITEEQSADLVALAFRIAEGTGYYRAPAGPVRLHLVFGEVRVTGL